MIDLIRWLCVTAVTNVTVTGDRDTLRAAILDRAPGTALVTVCNHDACLDDPVVMSLLIAERVPRALVRHGWCASDVCFTNPLFSWFFHSVNTHPVVRGAGLLQPGMRWAAEVVGQGRWMHVFPEGTTSSSALPMRWGVGRLIAEATNPVLVIPFAHAGMEELNPKGTWVPRVSAPVSIHIGEPLDMSAVFQWFAHLSANNSEGAWGHPFPPRREVLYQAVTREVEQGVLRCREATTGR